jgi:hypothetical protein
MFLTEIFIFLGVGLLIFMGLSFVVKHFIRNKE